MQNVITCQWPMQREFENCQKRCCCPWTRHWQQTTTAAAMSGGEKWERFGGWDSLAYGGNSCSLQWVPFISLACRLGFTSDSYLSVCATPQGCCHPMTETQRVDANQGLPSTSRTCETEVLRRLGLANRLLNMWWGDFIWWDVSQQATTSWYPFQSLKLFSDALINVYFENKEKINELTFVKRVMSSGQITLLWIYQMMRCRLRPVGSGALYYADSFWVPNS